MIVTPSATVIASQFRGQLEADRLSRQLMRETLLGRIVYGRFEKAVAHRLMPTTRIQLKSRSQSGNAGRVDTVAPVVTVRGKPAQFLPELVLWSDMTPLGRAFRVTRFLRSVINKAKTAQKAPATRG